MMRTFAAAKKLPISYRQSVQSLSVIGRSFSTPSWASVDPEAISPQFNKSISAPHKLSNLVNGEWQGSEKYWNLVCPLSGSSDFISMPDTQVSELQPFIDSMSSVPKSGLHNPLKNPERYNMYAEISYQVSKILDSPEGEDFFIKAIQAVMPKSHIQARNEVRVTNVFLKTFAGDGLRFAARGFTVSGDYAGQESKGYRWPLGACALIAPFNFPFEIPVLQLMGALFMGNKLVVKGSEKTSLVIEEFIRLLHHCGMPKTDVDLIHCHGGTMEHLLLNSPIRLTQFTGSSTVADHLAEKLKGKVKLEDAGFDWKILGPDAPTKSEDLDYIAYVCDQDAYAMSGQKCSAQSILFAHENYAKQGIFDRMEAIAAKRSLKENTISPVLSVNNDTMNAHIKSLLELPGAKVLFGGELKNKEEHQIPEIYGSFSPTAVFVPLSSIMQSQKSFELCTTEIFGPFQIVTTYEDGEIDQVLECCERMSHHLTAAVVSNDQRFLHKVLANTVNGTSYGGLRARTTGAPANHWFGPAGDPRGAGIGSPEAVRLVWSCHREIVKDYLLPETYNADSMIQT